MGFVLTFKGASLILDTAKVASVMQDLRLFKNNFTPSKSSVLADFTEGDYSGYALATLTWFPPALNADPKMQMNAASVTFTVAAGGVANDVYGIFTTDGGGNVTGFEKFPAPVTMAAPGHDSVFYQLSPTLDSV